MKSIIIYNALDSNLSNVCIFRLGWENPQPSLQKPVWEKSRNRVKFFSNPSLVYCG